MTSRTYGLVLACLLVAGLAVAGLAPGSGASKEARSTQSRIVAKYDAGLAGITFGDFKVVATFDDRAYAVNADGTFALLGGLLYKASGKTASKGRLSAARPEPARFTLEYEDNKKHEKRRISFKRGVVSDVNIVPGKKRKDPRKVPVTEEQLKDVLDPLTAAFLSVQSEARPGDLQVCRQTIRVFDGTQRFDLKLSPKRPEELGRRAPEGVSGRAAVCQVRYRPVSGYRPDHPGVKYMTETDAIEAWLVPVAGTGFYVPYKIVVPTSWGDGTVTLTGLHATPDTSRRANAD